MKKNIRDCCRAVKPNRFRLAGCRSADARTGEVAWHRSRLPSSATCRTAAIREAPFARVVAEVNRDNDLDFVMHAGDIKAGSERCDDGLIEHRFSLYQTFQRAFVFTPGGQRVDGLSPCEQRPVQTRSSVWPSCGLCCSFHGWGRRPAGRSGLCGHRLRAAPTPSSLKT